jgi:hypothetical protein
MSPTEPVTKYAPALMTMITNEAQIDSQMYRWSERLELDIAG